MDYQFFLPMVLRWRASRSEAPLITPAEETCKPRIETGASFLQFVELYESKMLKKDNSVVVS